MRQLVVPEDDNFEGKMRLDLVFCRQFRAE